MRQCSFLAALAAWVSCYQLKTAVRKSSATAGGTCVPKMLYRYLGGTGLKVSKICLGTMTFGASEARPGQADQQLAHKMLDRYVAAGGNFIDTADIYQMGEAEKIVGSWLAKQPRRDRIILATKLCLPMCDDDPNSRGLSRHHIMTNVEESLARLQTSYIDLLYVHVWDHGTPIEETLRALTDLVRSGKVRYLGASNFAGWQIQKASDVSQYRNLERFCCLQNHYNLLVRDNEWEVNEVCANEGIALLPWSPLKGGFLSGVISPSGAPEGTRVHHVTTKNLPSMQSHPHFPEFDNDRTWRIIDECKAIGKEIGATVPQVAIAWLLHKSIVPSVVIGAKTLEQLEENMAAGKVKLSEKQMKRLDEVSDVPLPYPYEQIERLNKRREGNHCDASMTSLNK